MNIPVGASSSAARDYVQGWTECRESAWMHVATCFRFVLGFNKELASSEAAGSYMRRAGIVNESV